MVQRRRHGRFHASKSNHFKRPKSYKVVCQGCGKEVIIPVPPPEGKKLLCMECFTKSGGSKEKT